MMDDDPDENGAYGRSVECTWVGHSFKNYLQIGIQPEEVVWKQYRFATFGNNIDLQYLETI